MRRLNPIQYDGKDVCNICSNNEDDIPQIDAKVFEYDVDENVSEEFIEDAEERNEGKEEDNQVVVEVEERKEYIKYMSKDFSDIVGVTDKVI